MPPAVIFADYVAYDKDVQTSAELTTKEIADAAHQEDPISDEDDDNSDNSGDLEDNDAPSHTKMVRSINTNRARLGGCSDVSDGLLCNMDSIEKYVYMDMLCLKQTKISNFFKH